MQASGLSLIGYAYSAEDIATKIGEAKDSLVIDRAELLEVPPAVFQLTQLTAIDLSENCLSKVEGIEGLRRLSHLVLHANILVSLPAKICFMQLVTLDLSYNHLSDLPENFGDLVSLTHLFVSHNKLAALPDSFVRLKQLENLTMDHNRVSRLPHEFSLPKLRVMIASHNQFPKMSIKNVPELKFLNVANNPLERVSVEGHHPEFKLIRV